MSRPRIYCECGCKEKVKSGNNFVLGHNGRGVKQSEETCRKRVKTRRANGGYECSEETRKRMRESSKKRIRKPHTEETKRKIGLRHKGKQISDKQREAATKKAKELWQDPKYRQMQIDSHNKYWSDNTNRERMSESCVKKFENKEERNKISNTLKQYHKDNPGIMQGVNNPMFGKKYTCSEEKKNNIAVALIEKYKNIEERIRVSCIHQNISRKEWTGFLNDEPYCQEFTKELKEFIKERDNFECQNPDCWKTSDILGIHHIDYNKKNCKIENLITTCLSCNARANTNRKHWKTVYESIVVRK